jgi:RNA polymerase sigma factor (TIGR02999 family)
MRKAICFAASALSGDWGGKVQRNSSGRVTELLVRWRGGDQAALDALMPLVYDELRRLAQHYLRYERADHTLQSTALVHEAYVRLVGQDSPPWQSRAHFFGIAARLMRQILVEHARAHHAAKRGGHSFKLTLEDVAAFPQAADVDLVALDDALRKLSAQDARQSRIVELRFFAGLTIEDAAEVLEISRATVTREWTIARAWLYREIARSAPA